jgi:hypothetical protein
MIVIVLGCSHYCVVNIVFVYLSYLLVELLSELCVLHIDSVPCFWCACRRFGIVAEVRAQLFFLQPSQLAIYYSSEHSTLCNLSCW